MLIASDYVDLRNYSIIIIMYRFFRLLSFLTHNELLSFFHDVKKFSSCTFMYVLFTCECVLVCMSVCVCVRLCGRTCVVLHFCFVLFVFISCENMFSSCASCGILDWNKQTPTIYSLNKMCYLVLFLVSSQTHIFLNDTFHY